MIWIRTKRGFPRRGPPPRRQRCAGTGLRWTKDAINAQPAIRETLSKAWAAGLALPSICGTTMSSLFDSGVLSAAFRVVFFTPEGQTSLLPLHEDCRLASPPFW